MKLRTRFLLILILLAAGGSIAFGISSYVSTADRMHSEIDQSLDAAVQHELAELQTGKANDDTKTGIATPVVATDDDDVTDPGRPRNFDQILVQWLDGSGAVTSQTSAYALPVGDDDTTIAASPTLSQSYRSVRLEDGERYRILTSSTGVAGGGAVQAGRSLAETDRLLEALRNRTIIIMLVVTAAAGIIGWLLAHQVTRRIEHLTDTAEEVAKTGRLDIAVTETGRDETSRLAGAFNQMLAKLASSNDSQQRLVQDASHELRTPLTSVRTNLSLLRRFEQLDPQQRRQVLDDLDSESRELTLLVDELVELATDRRDTETVEEISLAELTERVAERARRRTGRQVVVVSDDAVLLGRPQAIERALSNLLDNAAKFTDDDSPIEVVGHGGTIEVRDQGPGFPPGDLDLVFDRFYRAVDMRSRPGSGLGLAIVREIAESHGGSVYARNRPGGGAVVGMSLPVSRLHWSPPPTTSSTTTQSVHAQAHAQAQAQAQAQPHPIFTEH